ncbi:MAG: dinitrogenase iron-molybdenum cofactor biosynthesis protein [Calditrichaeota bacterium]|nr:dinitrogenase iron-molybdenum cofactor biosynthesis protein [Calditrichota bacterium]
MKIAVSGTGDSLDAAVDERFGRCPYFVFVESETMAYEAVPNPGAEAMGGAATKAAQVIADKQADVVLTGAVGPNAERSLAALGVRVVTDISGTTIREAVRNFITKQETG